MSWEQYRSVMERYAIKTDDMATEDAYFMATHVPFSQLEVYYGGRTSTTPKLLSEEKVFEDIICNPNNEHRMVIVRGNNGTGKSHLIRYLHAKLVKSPSTVYDSTKEQLIFLRRLNNSVRGAFSQLIEQHVIKDPDVEEKLRKFVSSSDSKDEAAFKTDILFSYVATVSNDQSGDTYKPVICRDIASYLSDSRVREYLLREGGAISRCYNVITAPSNQVLKESTIFSEDDFNVSKIIRAVIKQGDPQAADFASTLKGDDSEIARLVSYLNRFTRDVVQRCADISSESTKTVFTQLRKDLKKQGKNLTLFIEDFTGFTGIDSELITVLSTEHGGNYSDLCRVTAVIGITDAYYDQFRDNFTDRVTHQISVTDQSYGADNFLIQMTGHYLNAIYCNPDQLRQWNESGADIGALPISQFKTPCKWETTTIEGKEVTLYPFNSKALLKLYESLPVKTPRMFLKEVIRAQLKEYFDGKEYGDNWDFPMNPANIQMSRGPHSSAIDRMDNLSTQDQNRVKAVLALWGDGSASGIKEADGTITFGGVNKVFFEDIGLGIFTGIGDILVKPIETSTETGNKILTESINPPIESPSKAKVQLDGATKNYIKYKDDITGWFTKGEPLKFDADYRGWLRTFIKGTDHPSSAQPGAIDWQDIGIPAYIAEARLSDLAGYYIDDQKTPTNREIIVFMDRSAESRDVLLALNEWNYAKGWEFEGAVYYQQRLITWLERRKTQIVEKVTATKTGEPNVPVLEWCLALQYLKSCILGHKVNTESICTTVTSLFDKFNKDDMIVRETSEWNDLIQFVQHKEAEFDSALKFLRRGAATTMGGVRISANADVKSCYRADELICTVEKLTAANWDIESEIPEELPTNHMLFNHAALLKMLYSKIKKVMNADTERVSSVLNNLTWYVGELNQNNLVETLSSIQKLFATFAANSIMGNNDLRTKYEKPPIETANDILKHIKLLVDVSSCSAVTQLTAYTGNSLHRLANFQRDLQTIALKAEQEENKARKDIAKMDGFDDLEDLSEAARASMEALCERLEAMEVYNDAAN